MKPMQSLELFKVPVWVKDFPEYLPPVTKVVEKYIKAAKKRDQSIIKKRDKKFKTDIGDFGMSHHSTDLYQDAALKTFASFIGQKSFDFLDWMGFDLRKHMLTFTEMWVQEFAREGGGHHMTHIHSNNHVSGFYFLKCSEETSFPIFYDPRSGAGMIHLPEKDKKKLTYANESAHIKPKPGALIIFPSYLPHGFEIDSGLKPFQFIHFNLHAIPLKSISND